MGFGVYGFGVLTFRTGQGRACSGILNRKADAATNLNRHRPLHNSTLNPKPYSILLVPKTIQTRSPELESATPAGPASNTLRLQ